MISMHHAGRRSMTKWVTLPRRLQNSWLPQEKMMMYIGIRIFTDTSLLTEPVRRTAMKEERAAFIGRWKVMVPMAAERNGGAS